MSDSGFHKCACENCQGHLEFPAHAAGITTTCPHCGVETRLIAHESTPAPTPPPPPPPPPPARDAEAPPAEAPKPVALAPIEAASTDGKLKRALNIVGSVLLGLVVVAGVGWKIWRKVRQTGSAVEAVKPDAKPAPATPAAAPVPAPSAAPAAPPTSIVLATGTPPARKAGEDLQVTGFEIHKAKDGNLQYIIGVVTNHSARQYFNVRLEFALTRAGGKAGDTATDLVRNLPANVGSTFKVNVIGTAPVSAAQLVKLEGEKE
jgi:hypothetical protein